MFGWAAISKIKLFIVLISYKKMISNFLRNDMFVVLFCYYFVVLFFDIIKGGCNVNRPMLSGHQGAGLKIIKTGLWVTKKMVTARSIDGSLIATNVTRLGVWS